MRLLRSPLFWFWAPKVATAISFVAMVCFPAMVTDVRTSYAFAFAVTGSSLITLVVLGTQQFTRRTKLFGLTLQAILLIVNFATIFAETGLATSGSSTSGTVDLWTGLYFSIVTWTTLGYGDFTPKPDFRLIAAMEALAGYIYFGLIVGVTASWIGTVSEEALSPTPAPPTRD